VRRYRTAPTFIANTIMDPCQEVRTTCRQWMEQEPAWDQPNGRRSVKVHKEHMPRLAEDIIAKKEQSPSWIEWDEENWHYSGDKYTGSVAQRNERVALYILALDAINFCFWPNRIGENGNNPLEYEHLAIGLRKLAEADDESGDPTVVEDGTAVVKCAESYALSPQNLKAMTAEKIDSLLKPHLGGYYLDNVKKRAMLWSEVGEALLQNFEGSATLFLDKAENHAPNLVQLVIKNFPGFCDQAKLDGGIISFLKRAQIFVGDVNAALKLGLGGMDRLTTFADYRVPQILRHFGIMEYSSSLELTVDTEEEIKMESTDEISIRAATVAAVDDLVEFLNRDERVNSEEPFTAVTVDWYLWQVGERMHQDGALKPFHRVRTQFY
jgi:hypothetical protein